VLDRDTGNAPASQLRLDTLDAELTLRCPLRCVHCSAFAGPFMTSELPTEPFLASLAKHGPLRELYLSGGEPFLHQNFLEIVARGSALADVTIAYSSGTWGLTGHPGPLPTRILRSAKSAGLHRVDLSLYAGEPLGHDAVTGRRGSFSATVATARAVVRAGLGLGIHTVALGKGAGARLLAVAATAHGLGAQRMHVLALADQGRARARMAKLEPDESASTAVSSLIREYDGSWLVLSRGLRRGLVGDAHSERDSWRTGFLSVSGHLSPGEGHRDQTSVGSILTGFSIDELISQLVWA